MKSVFLSYRRADSQTASHAIYYALYRALRWTNLFMDVDDIPPGSNFPDALDRALRHCSILLAIVGPAWLTSADSAGHRRLDNPADFVRLELEAALSRGIPVVLLLLPETAPPDATHLPASLQPLARCPAFQVRFDDNGGPVVTDVVAFMRQTMPSLDAWLPSYPGIALFAVLNVMTALPFFPGNLVADYLIQAPSLLCLGYMIFRATRLRQASWASTLLVFTALCCVFDVFALPVLTLVVGVLFGLFGPKRNAHIQGLWLAPEDLASQPATMAQVAPPPVVPADDYRSNRPNLSGLGHGTPPAPTPVPHTSDPCGGPAVRPSLLFISHIATDSTWSGELADALSKAGYAVWSESLPLASLVQHQEALARCMGVLLVLTPEAWQSPLIQEDLRNALTYQRPVVSLLRQPTDVTDVLLIRPWIDVAFLSGGGAARSLLKHLPALLTDATPEPMPSASALRERAASMYQRSLRRRAWRIVGDERESRFVRFHAMQAMIVRRWEFLYVLSWCSLAALIFGPFLAVPMLNLLGITTFGIMTSSASFTPNPPYIIAACLLFPFCILFSWYLALVGLDTDKIKRRITSTMGNAAKPENLRDSDGRVRGPSSLANSLLARRKGWIP